MSTIQRIKSGIPGFDAITNGGLVKNSINLVTGGTGTGKTIFGLQYLFHGAKDCNEKGIYISLEESEEELKDDAREIGMNFNEVAKKVKFICLSPYDTSDLASIFKPSVLKHEIESFKPCRIVIDSVTALVMGLENNFERKKEIYTLSRMLKEMDCTTLLLSEIPSESALSTSSGSFSRYGVEEFLCDSVIMLHYMGIGGESDRALRVIKMRRTRHVRGPVPMALGSCGVKILKQKF